MKALQRWWWILTLVLVVVSTLMFWSTFRFWTMSEEARAELNESDPGKLRELQQESIRLGLDLQGGVHTVLRVKTEELTVAEQEGAVDRAITILRNRIDALGVNEPIIQKQGNDQIVVDLPGYTNPEQAEQIIGQTAVLEFKLLETFDNAQLILSRIDSVIAAREGLSSDTDAADIADTLGDLVDAAVDTATAATDGESDDLLAELLGADTLAGDTVIEDDPFAFDEDAPIGGLEETPFTSRLEPSITNSARIPWPGYAVNDREKLQVERWLALPEVQAVIPADVQFAWSTRSTISNNREVWSLYLLKRKVEFLGKFLEDISMGVGQQTGGFQVNFALSGDGAARFAQLTGANVDKPLAIVIDDRVESAPIINDRIRNSGVITMGGDASQADARTLEIVLKAGALPAPVEFIEKNVIGASLGQDSIRKGLTSTLIGLGLVLLFMAVYYRLSGVIADFALLFNLFFLLAVMAGLGATLSMPGIAGIILTIGISVDSNILIFERIREELRTGKTVRAAIDAGYDRAFAAILDSHVTTLITAAALFVVGSGPIKGFAITLFWGVLISLYTAYVITKGIFDIRKAYKTISI